MTDDVNTILSFLVPTIVQCSQVWNA